MQFAFAGRFYKRRHLPGREAEAGDAFVGHTESRFTGNAGQQVVQLLEVFQYGNIFRCNQLMTAPFAVAYGLVAQSLAQDTQACRPALKQGQGLGAAHMFQVVEQFGRRTHTGKAGITGIADLAKEEIKKVAIGIPESVPAGKYAQEALTNAQLWDALQPKLVQAKDVRQVLQYVETGNAEAGFVYKTDALTSDKVGIAFAVDPQTYSPVVYPIGIVKATKNAEQAGVLYDYLQSQAALDIFIKYGFSVPVAK